jgi:hypothetical protein
MEVSGQLHTPAALPSGKETVVLLDRRLGGPQDRYERSGKVQVLFDKLNNRPRRRIEGVEV